MVVHEQPWNPRHGASTVIGKKVLQPGADNYPLSAEGVNNPNTTTEEFYTASKQSPGASVREHEQRPWGTGIPSYNARTPCPGSRPDSSLIDNVVDILFPTQYNVIPADPGQMIFFTDTELSKAVVGHMQCRKTPGPDSVPLAQPLSDRQ
ncbi:hypothetical protein J6590_068554 [Homalodisca vitripennis]|nr:hypothetical protein J6590_068554 [Homalodisca vitripennis]